MYLQLTVAKIPFFYGTMKEVIQGNNTVIRETSPVSTTECQVSAQFLDPVECCLAKQDQPTWDFADCHIRRIVALKP